MDVISHYDRLVREDNDPFRDPPPLKKYMDRWDGQAFIDSMGLTQEKTALEIGMGTGRLASKTAPLCGTLVGIDISPMTVERAKENLTGYDNIRFVCGDFLTYEFDQTFDVIYSSLTMMHFEDKRAVIGKVCRLLARGGRFCLSIDKNQSEYIDMSGWRLRVFPDKAEDIIGLVDMTGMSVTDRYETDFAHIIICEKELREKRP